MSRVFKAFDSMGLEYEAQPTPAIASRLFLFIVSIHEELWGDLVPAGGGGVGCEEGGWREREKEEKEGDWRRKRRRGMTEEEEEEEFERWKRRRGRGDEEEQEKDGR